MFSQRVEMFGKPSLIFRIDFVLSCYLWLHQGESRMVFLLGSSLASICSSWICSSWAWINFDLDFTRWCQSIHLFKGFPSKPTSFLPGPGNVLKVAPATRHPWKHHSNISRRSRRQWKLPRMQCLCSECEIEHKKSPPKMEGKKRREDLNQW